MALIPWRAARPTEIEIKTYITAVRVREEHRTRREIGRQAFILGLVYAGACVVFALLGVLLVLLGDEATDTRLEVFGHTVSTGSVGVACLTVAMISLVLSLRGVLRVMTASVDSLRDPTD